jgi:hypothetical protein
VVPFQSQEQMIGQYIVLLPIPGSSSPHDHGLRVPKGSKRGQVPMLKPFSNTCFCHACSVFTGRWVAWRQEQVDNHSAAILHDLIYWLWITDGSLSVDWKVLPYARSLQAIQGALSLGSQSIWYCHMHGRWSVHSIWILFYLGHYVLGVVCYGIKTM